MDAEALGRFAEAAVVLTQHPHDEPLFEFMNGVVEQHASFDHFIDQLLQALGDHASSFPVNRRKASTYFSRVFRTTSSGSAGTGGCLFQRIASR